MSKKRSILPGIVLVAVGVFLLLDRFDALDRYNVNIFQWDLMLPALAVILGLNLWIRALRNKPRCGVFTGTLLVVLGAFFFAWNYGWIDQYFYYYKTFPIFPTAIGLAFLSMFMFDYHKWWAILPAAPFLLVGFTSFCYTMGILDIYDLEDSAYYIEDIFFDFRTYVPVIIVFIGLIIIISSLKKAKKPHFQD